MTDLRSYTHGPDSKSPAKQLVILLHGLGADGRDLLGLAPMFARGLPDAVFVSPDAPYPCDMAPMGRQWFSLQSWTPDAILRGVQNATPILQQFIAEQMKKYNVSASKTALVGFSQGTMMSLYAGPRFPEKLAGVVGYSGALVTEDSTDWNALHKIPLCLIHGDFDMVVPVTAYHHAQQVLNAAGFPLSGGITRGLMHSIDERGISDALAFLQKILA